MNRTPYIKQLFAVMAVVFLSSCDNDFNVLGTDIVGNDNFEVGVKADYVPNVTNVNVGAIESVNLPVNPLGIYNDPVYGETVANFATQVQLETVNPDFGVNPHVETVVLSVPYYSTLKSAAASTETLSTYELDSIFGADQANAKLKLSVFRSGYFIRDVNPADQLPQAYYTDQNSDFDNAKLALLNDPAFPAQSEQFFFDSKEIVERDASNVITKRSAPAMTLNLSPAIFSDLLLNAPSGSLANNNVFKNYFRGLYFKVEGVAGAQGNLAMMNFRNGTITVNYTVDPTSGSDRISKKLVLKLSGNSVSLMSQSPSPAPDSQKIFLKGGANHSMAVIDLFAGNELADLKSKNWLINDASLTFTVSDPGSANSQTTKRLYLYDLNNKRQLYDYSLDQSVSPGSSKYNKSLFGGIIKKDATTGRETYRIRITNHVMRMVNSDSTNVRLGLVVTEDINSITNKRVKTPQGVIKVVPTMSVAHPFGIVLWGNDAPLAADRPKFEIYYTTPK